MYNDGINDFDDFDPNYYPVNNNIDSNELNADVAGTIAASFIRDECMDNYS